MDRIEEWRVFVTVASLRSFSRAARQLGRSPQAVTRAIASLEARIGTRLLNRTTRAVTLSHDGARYLETSRRAIAEVDALEAPDEPASELRGTLAITAPVLFGQLHVVPIVARFLGLHRSAAIKLALHDRVVSLADEGIDLAVRIGELPDSALRARQVGHVRTVLVASPAYLERAGTPRTAEALSKHACIAFLATSPFVDRWVFGKRSVAVTPRLIVNTAQAAIDAAIAGVGLARVLSYQVDRLIATSKLVVVLPSTEPVPVPIHLVSLPGTQARIATQFADHAALALRRRLAREPEARER